MSERFRKFASAIATAAGSHWAFILAVVTIVAWAVSGPFLRFSDTWQLVINTATTLVTFLMVFIIQNTQNRDSKAFHAKLDELILATRGADNLLVVTDEMTDEEIDQKLKQFRERAQRGRQT